MHDADAAHDCAAAQPSYPPRAVAWYATIVLAIMYWLSVPDSLIISLLVGPIKAYLGISDTQFGLFNGLAFAITFCLFDLVARSVSDCSSRHCVILIYMSICSHSTPL